MEKNRKDAERNKGRKKKGYQHEEGGNNEDDVFKDDADEDEVRAFTCFKIKS